MLTCLGVDSDAPIMSWELGCDYCRVAVLRADLPALGESLERQVIVLRCPRCLTHWIETAREAHPVTDEEAVREAPEVVGGPPDA